MQPTGPTSGISQTIAGMQRPAALPLQVGQQLQATVLENRTGKLLLAIGNRQLSTESSLPFERGQILKLEVRSLGQQPVLRVISALQESPAAMAVRTLLPRYGPSTPLLASLSQILQSPQAPVPPLVREAARTLIRQLPDASGVATQQGIKRAIQRSGGFLERHLSQSIGQTQPPSSGLSISGDYKANLIRLIHVLREWPGSGTGAATAARPSSTTANPAAADGQSARPTDRSGQVRLDTELLRSGSAPARPGVPQPSVATTAPSPTAATEGKIPPQSQASTSSDPVATNPQTFKRAIQSGADRTLLRPAAGGAGQLVGTTGTTTLGNDSSVTGGTRLNPPPPFSGVVPVPQTSAQASLDLLNRLGNLRLDLLQQTEAALARIQLNQLASLPRDGEQRLVEWLFDIPVRRGNDVDLWSARLYRDSEDDSENPDKSAAQWQIQLAFDLPGLGPMQAQISLQDERISTRFWATEPETLPLLRENLHELRASLSAVGLEVGDIDCQHGAITETPGRQQDPLINEKA